MEPKSYNRVCAEISLENIVNNVRIIKSGLNEKTKICAIVKANAYGHGSVAVSHAVSQYVDVFAVATIEEGIELRDAGIKKPILNLGFTPSLAAHDAIAYDISLTVFDIEAAREYADIAKKMGKKVHAHLKVDTGMGRIGLPADENGIKEAFEIAKVDGICIDGVFSHFSRADENTEMDTSEQAVYTRGQFEKFVAFCDEFAKSYDRLFIRHICNSAGAVVFPEAQLDMVRLGIIMYGMYPSEVVPKIEGLKPALSLVSWVSYVKTVAKGTPVSYGGTFITERETVIATIPVGYGDGYRRSLSNRGYVIIDGHRAPILGRVCMDQMMVDVTDISGVKRGTQVVLIGRDGDECISAEDIGEMTGSFNYEVICDIGRRIPRSYDL